MTNTEAWDRIAARRPAGEVPPTDSARYGPDGPTEADLRLLGDVQGKRVIDLGCGTGQAAIAFAKHGATALALDTSAVQLAHARKLAEAEEAKVEWHQSDLADLAFLRADSIDLAFSAGPLAEVEDLGRSLRQIHRVLRPDAAFAFSYEHPFELCTELQDDPAGGPAHTVVTRSYTDARPVAADRFGETFTLYPRTIAEVFAACARAGFRPEMIVEPPPRPGRRVPDLIIWRVRKEGI